MESGASLPLLSMQALIHGNFEGAAQTRVYALSAPGGDTVGAVLSVLGMGGIVLSILVWQEGGEYVGALMAIGAIALARWPGG